MTDIFGYFVSRPTDNEKERIARSAYARWFIASFPATEMRGADAVMYECVKECVTLGTPLTEKYFQVYLAISLKELIVKNNIHVEGTEHLRFDDVVQTATAVQVTVAHMNAEYYRMLNTPCETEDFVPTAKEWMTNQRNKALRKVLNDSFEMMNSPVGKKIGDGDAVDHMVTMSALISDIYGMAKLEELAYARSEDEEYVFMADTGIKSIDSIIGGFYSGTLVELEGASGAGKTRFTTGTVIYRAAVVFKKNCLYFTLEQSKREIRSILISRHVFYLFQKQIPSEFILAGSVPEQYKEMVAIAEADLFDSGKYGKIDIQAITLETHTMVSKMKMLDSLHGPYDFMIVDHMAVLQFANRNRGQGAWEGTKDAYIAYKAYARNTGKCCIAVNQLDGDNAKASEKDKEISIVGGAGGQESRRSADLVLVIIRTPTMQAQNLSRVDILKSRNTASEGSIILKTLIAISLWMDNVVSRKI